MSRGDLQGFPLLSLQQAHTHACLGFSGALRPANRRTGEADTDKETLSPVAVSPQGPQRCHGWGSWCPSPNTETRPPCVQEPVGSRLSSLKN